MNDLLPLENPVISLNPRVKKGVKIFFLIILAAILIGSVYDDFTYDDFDLSSPLTAFIIILFLLAPNLAIEKRSTIIKYNVGLIILLIIIHLLFF